MLPWGRGHTPTIRIEVVAGSTDRPLDDLIAEMRSTLNQIKQLGAQLMADISELRTEVQAQTSVVDGVEALVQRLADQIENAGSQEEIDALVADLRANSADLSNLVTANTPAEGGGDGGGDTGGGDAGGDTGGGDVGEPGAGGTDGDNTGGGPVVDPDTGDIIQA